MSLPRVNKVGHVVLAVTDLERSKAFYRDVLGMEVISDRPPEESVFLSFGLQHHDLALFKAPEGAERGTLGMVHMAFQVGGGPAELKALREHAISAGAEVVAQQFHGITRSVYLRDPDGYTVEIYSEVLTPEEGLAYMRAQTGHGVTEPLTL